MLRSLDSYTSTSEAVSEITNAEDFSSIEPTHQYDTIVDNSCSQIFRSAVIGILINFGHPVSGRITEQAVDSAPSVEIPGVDYDVLPSTDPEPEPTQINQEAPSSEVEVTTAVATDVLLVTTVEEVQDDEPPSNDALTIRSNDNISDEPDLETAERNIHLEAIQSSLCCIMTDLGKLSTAHALSSNSVDRIKEKVNSRLRDFSKDLSDFAQSLDSKISKSSINQLQSQQLFSDKLDLLTSRINSVDSKLATIISTLLTKPTVIPKKRESGSGGDSRRQEEFKRPSKEQSKKRSEPDSSRKDRGPVDKRSKH